MQSRRQDVRTTAVDARMVDRHTTFPLFAKTARVVVDPQSLTREVTDSELARIVRAFEVPSLHDDSDDPERAEILLDETRLLHHPPTLRVTEKETLTPDELERMVRRALDAL